MPADANDFITALRSIVFCVLVVIWRVYLDSQTSLCTPARAQLYKASPFCSSYFHVVRCALSHAVVLCVQSKVASYYVKDALAGRESTVCIHDRKSLAALKVSKNLAIYNGTGYNIA